MSPAPSDPVVWTHTTIDGDAPPLCYGRGCFNEISWERRTGVTKRAYFCQACAERAMEREVSHGE